MNVPEKQKEVLDNLREISWSRDFYYLCDYVGKKADNRTKYLDSSEVEYIKDALESKVGLEWEARAEFMYRLLDRLVARGNSMLLLSAVCESVRRAVEPEEEFFNAARISYENWETKYYGMTNNERQR